MGIKPALGWLALLLFTTTAQAEGSKDLLKGLGKTKGRGGTPPAAAVAEAPVVAKTKAPPPALVPASAPAAASSASGSLVVLENAKPRGDYEAEIYSGVPLDGSLAKERGYDKGLVAMVFERQRQATFRVGHDKIRRVVRMMVDEKSALAPVVAKPMQTRLAARDHLDVVETEDGIFLVETTTHNGGIFTTSAVYTFARNAPLDQRIGALEVVPMPLRARLREALVVAEWTPLKESGAGR
jgi:hypothetical protein